MLLDFDDDDDDDDDGDDGDDDDDDDDAYRMTLRHATTCRDENTETFFSTLGSLRSQPCTSMSYIHTVMIMMNIESRSDG